MAKHVHCAEEDLGLDTAHPVRFLDSTTDDESRPLSPSPIPTCVIIPDARQHDARGLDAPGFRHRSRPCVGSRRDGFKRLNAQARAGAFFAAKANDSLRISRLYSQHVEQSAGGSSDQIDRPTSPNARADVCSLLRKARFFDDETFADLVFLANTLKIPPLCAIACAERSNHADILLSRGREAG